MTLEEFERGRRSLNHVVARALDHGVTLSNCSMDYGTRSRRAQTNHSIRRANRHLDFFLNPQSKAEPDDYPDDYRVGVQAYMAMQQALRAVVYATGEWCPEVVDIDMLIDFARRTDGEFDFYPSVTGPVHTQYSPPREGLPIQSPLSGLCHYRAKVETDVASVLVRVQALKEAWT